MSYHDGTLFYADHNSAPEHFCSDSRTDLLRTPRSGSTGNCFCPSAASPFTSGVSAPLSEATLVSRTSIMDYEIGIILQRLGENVKGENNVYLLCTCYTFQ